jgi:hypothetical protein
MTRLESILQGIEKLPIGGKKKKKFLPVVNPLGDTAAFSNWNSSISAFRHRKGGRRG